METGSEMIEGAAMRACRADGMIWEEATEDARDLYREIAASVLDFMLGANKTMVTNAELYQLRNEVTSLRLRAITSARRGPARAHRPACVTQQPACGCARRSATG